MRIFIVASPRTQRSEIVSYRGSRGYHRLGTVNAPPATARAGRGLFTNETLTQTGRVFLCVEKCLILLEATAEIEPACADLQSF